LLGTDLSFFTKKVVEKTLKRALSLKKILLKKGFFRTKQFFWSFVWATASEQ